MLEKLRRANPRKCRRGPPIKPDDAGIRIDLAGIGGKK
jgi:hypothetical protein